MQHASSRRHFVKTTAASVAAPFILPSHVWSAETPASERRIIGCIGMGKMMSGHLGSFLGRPEVQIVAVCDVDTTRREHAKKTVEERYTKNNDASFKGCTAYADFRELLARKDIEAVIIATPDHWHAFIAIAALNAGKDVYCEKPLTHNIHEAVTLIDAVRSNKRILQTGSQQRSSKEFRVACELVRNGIIGKIKHVETQFGPPAKPNANPEEAMEPGLDWDMWCGPGPLAPYSSVLSPRGVHTHFPAWRNTREYGGGMITDWGAHHIDIAQWGLGEDEHGPVEIIAPENYADATDGAKLIYATGIPLHHNGKGKGVSFFGENGEVHVNRGKFEFILGGKTIHKFWDKETDKGTSLDREVILTEKEFLADAKVKLYNSKNHHEDWLNSIKTREKPICDVAIGASTAISCHLMSQCYYHGGTLKWNPEKHVFLGDTDPKWLTRDYRGDWKV